MAVGAGACGRPDPDGRVWPSLAQEDPSFRVETDRDTAETLVWGMGELHLEVMVERLRSEWKVDEA